ncbi:hypothetical protein XELAEV_18013909mg [Xenopus laevis]|uniref:Uncharacterized protein n=1 Tax=Xenopus laevis TaxID=8355 RepID=A0A974DQF5_XENLA|nr:hypothetical protein XELAEV_18013909mg [Xenopus laevis]
MSYFKVLLSDLAQTCLDLEQIKSEHTKDHEQISRSFERTLLSILKQEQTILTLVEEEHRRLKDQLSSVQKANELALQNGVFEINTMVHEISTISSQLKQMLATSCDSDPVVKEIQKRSPRRRDATDCGHKPRSFFRLASKDTSKGRPVISASDASSSNNAHALKPKQHRRVQSAGSLPGSLHQGINRNRRTVQGTSAQKSVLRSASLPYIERLSRHRNSRPHRPLSASDRRDSSSSASSCWSNPRTLVSSAPPGSSRVYGRLSQNKVKSARASRGQLTYKVDGFSKSESNLLDCQRANGEKPKGLVRQFGKFGSGRAELNLPHGLYATKAGSLYVVDYGNRRLQIMNPRGKILQQIALEAKNYFDVAVSNRGLVALTNSTDRTVEVYNKHGRLLQVISKNFGAPRGITTNYQDEFIVADMKLGTICTLILHPVTGCQKESTIIPGFNKPYLVASNSQGLLAITERGLDGGCCVKVLREDWQILKILGLKENPGPKLCNPWGVCIDSEGGVLVADWGNTHSIVYYPPKRPAKVLVSEGLSSPRGLALWQDTLLLVADSMHNCIKVFQYQDM